MARNKTYFRTPPQTLIQQKIALKLSYPDSKVEISDGILRFSGRIKPSALSKEYEVLILYDGKKNPDAWIFGDELEGLDRENFPHKYSIEPEKKSVRVCLFYPKAKEWSKNRTIASTIVPWLVEWLYFYELWLITGEWLGGGIHPSVGEK